VEVKFPLINYKPNDSETRPEIDEIVLLALETAQVLASSDLVRA